MLIGAITKQIYKLASQGKGKSFLQTLFLVMHMLFMF